MKIFNARYLKSLTVVLALLVAAYISEVVALFVAYDMCCRSSPALELLPIPKSIFDVVRIPFLLFFLWSTTIILYFLAKLLFSINSLAPRLALVVRLALVFFSIAMPSLLHFHFVSRTSYYSKYGGRVLYSGGFPSETQIELVTLRSVTMWLLASCILLALHRYRSLG